MIPPCNTDSDSATVKNQGNDIGRNDRCPCGSGAKYKRCCLPQKELGGGRKTAAPWPSEPAEEFEYTDHGNRSVRARFSGGMITKDAGVMVWRELEEKFGIIAQIADCFEDHRDPSLIEFELEELLRQRIFGILQGHEDLLDHDELRGDHLFGTAIGREDPTGQDRRCEQDQDRPGAGKSTLNRIERGAEEGSRGHRYKKIVPDLEKLRACVAQLCMELIEELSEKPERVVLDLDPSDVLLHGNQEGRHYHTHYGDYCYLPLYAFLDGWPLDVLLSRSSTKLDGEAQKTIHELVETIRGAWEECTVIVRGDSDFSKVPELMDWIEAREGAEFVFGLGRNSRLARRITEPMGKARREFRNTGEKAKRYASFQYKPTTGSWSSKRRIVAKAEYLPGDDQHEAGENKRFVVTSIGSDEMADSQLYEEGYCPRGDSENGIYESQQQLFGDRASTEYESSNQLRMLWSAVAQLFVVLMRRIALKGTSLEGAHAETIRRFLLKVSAQIEVTKRNIWIHHSSHFPRQRLLAMVAERIRAGPTR